MSENQKKYSECIYWRGRKGDEVVNKGRWVSLIGKESACNAGDLGSISGSERSPGEGNGNPLQYACLENPMNRGAWQAIVYGVTRVGHDWATKDTSVKQILKHTN